MKAKRYFVETRAEGLPWTREGCNRRAKGEFVRHDDEEAAKLQIGYLRLQDDPLWRSASYRLVAAGKK